jgi:hypothetical protein
MPWPESVIELRTATAFPSRAAVSSEAAAAEKAVATVNRITHCVFPIDTCVLHQGTSEAGCTATNSESSAEAVLLVIPTEVLFK